MAAADSTTPRAGGNAVVAARKLQIRRKACSMDFRSANLVSPDTPMLSDDVESPQIKASRDVRCLSLLCTLCLRKNSFDIGMCPSSSGSQRHGGQGEAAAARAQDVEGRPRLLQRAVCAAGGGEPAAPGRQPRRRRGHGTCSIRCSFPAIDTR